MFNKMKMMLVLLLILLKEAGPTAAHNCGCSAASHCFCGSRGFSSVPQDLPTTITWLNLAGNHITTLSQSDFSRYRSLTYLSLSSNRISTVNGGAFYTLSRITRLHLSGNQLTILRSDTFVGLDNLQELFLGSNNIHSIEAGTFNATPYLLNLELQNNNISTFPVEDLSNLSMRTLSTLLMNHNQMETLPSAAYDVLASISTIDINNNPWQCDCRMLPFKQRMDGSYPYSGDYSVEDDDDDPFESQITCAGPAHLAGKSLLSDINPADLGCEETNSTESTPPVGSLAHSTLPGEFPTQSTPPVGFSVHSTPPGGFSTQSTPPGGFSTQSTPPGWFSTHSTSPGWFSTQSIPPGGFSTQSTPPGGSSTPSGEVSLLIGVLSGVAGVVLVSAVSLTIWCRIARKTTRSFTPDVTELTDRAAPHP